MDSVNPHDCLSHQTGVTTLALLLILHAEPGWTLAGSDRAFDARWYTRSVPDRPVNELKATGLIDAPLEQVHRVLLDFEGYARAMPSTAASRVLARDSERSAWVYLRYDVGVLSPRDTVVRMSWSGEGDVRWLRWTAAGARDELAPVADGVVRLPVNEGSWVLEARGQKTFVTYQLLSVPGGAVPAFLVNSINGAGVPRTLEALERAARGAAR